MLISRFYNYTMVIPENVLIFRQMRTEISISKGALCLQFTLKQFEKNFTCMYVLKYTGKMTNHNKRLTCRGS